MADRLSNQDHEDIKEAFVIYDRDQDGKCNMGEVASVIRSIGFSPTEDELRVISQEMEKSGKRTFDVQEVTNIIIKKLLNKETADELREAFRIFDQDGNGYVSAGEIRHVLTTLGEKLKDEEVDELILETNITSDGQISYEDFVKILDEGR